MSDNAVPGRVQLLAVVGALTFLFLPASPVRAASILWDTPTLITSSTDVSTTGSLLYAYNFGATGLPPVLGDALVNTVNFERFAIPLLSNTTVTVGSVSLDISGTGGFYTTSDLTGSSSAPFSNLPADYQKLLQSGVSTSSSTGILTLTMGGLTNGQNYMVQFWTNNSGGLLTFRTAGTIYTAGNAITLDDNNTGANGGIGQWVTASFIADSTVQTITLQSSAPGSDYSVMNAFQVRSVPEPSTAILLLFGTAICLCRRTVHRI